MCLIYPLCTDTIVKLCCCCCCCCCWFPSCLRTMHYSRYSKSATLLQQRSKPFPRGVPALLQKQTTPIAQTNLWREANCSCDFSRLSSKGKKDSRRCGRNWQLAFLLTRHRALQQVLTEHTKSLTSRLCNQNCFTAPPQLSSCGVLFIPDGWVCHIIRPSSAHSSAGFKMR